MKNVFCGIFISVGVFCANVNAELPENVNFCIPKQYNITYDCGAFGGNAPISVRLGYGQMYTSADIKLCGGNAWRVDDDTGTIITPNTTLPYTYTRDIKLTAVRWPEISVDYTKNMIGYSCTNLSGTGGNCPESNLAPGEWQIKFVYGDVSGVAICSGHHDNENIADVSLNQNLINDGGYCFCKITGINDQIFSDGVWIMNNVTFGTGVNTANCRSICAYYCATRIGTDSYSLRSAIYTYTGFTAVANDI
ncbi:MAG: hypothetical protein IJ560_03130 [Alphaproteobacteria bacterium]|nr:hypothetical protein [Alphaproteobacteria bacterium]